MAPDPRIRRLLLAPLRRAPLPVLSGPARGARLVVGPSSPRWLGGRVEPDVQRVLAGLAGAGDVVFDVGANVGFYTALAARRVGAAGRVVAFEPHPENARLLRRNTRRLRQVSVVEAAVGARGGRAALRADASLTAHVTAGAGDIEVVATTIDAHVAASGLAPSLVKVDVEGAELDVLEGMVATLAKHRPLLVIEMHGRNAEIAAALRAHRYVAEVIETPALALAEAGWGVHVVGRPAPD